MSRASDRQRLRPERGAKFRLRQGYGETSPKLAERRRAPARARGVGPTSTEKEKGARPFGRDPLLLPLEKPELTDRSGCAIRGRAGQIVRKSVSPGFRILDSTGSPLRFVRVSVHSRCETAHGIHREQAGCRTRPAERPVEFGQAASEPLKKNLTPRLSHDVQNPKRTPSCSVRGAAPSRSAVSTRNVVVRPDCRSGWRSSPGS